MITKTQDYEVLEDIERQMKEARPIFVAYIIRAGIRVLYGTDQTKWPEHVRQTNRQLKLRIKKAT